MTRSAIRAMTKDCPLVDCKIAEGRSTSTLLSWAETWDKQGNRIDVDPNKYSTEYRCLVCGKAWTVVTERGAIEIKEVEF